MKRILLPILGLLATTTFAQQWTEETQQLPAAGGTYVPFPGTEYGRDVDIDGDYNVVGTLNEKAVANFFDGSAWVEQAVFDPADLGFSDGFGGSVAISGNTIVVGAFLQNSFEGAAYVYVRTGTTWTFEQKLEASNGAANDRFGTSVDIDGDKIVVGAQLDQAYVFSRTGTTWTEDDILAPAGLEVSNSFGRSVSISGNTIAVGQSLNADGTGGAVYVFTGSGATWTLQEHVFAPDGAFGDQFGWAVSLNGDQLLASAITDGDNGASSGSAHVFVRDGSTWSPTVKLLASDGVANDRFGTALDLSTGSAVVASSAAHNLAGTVYTYLNNGEVLLESQKIVASDSVSFDSFGQSVAVTSNYLHVGSSYHTHPGIMGEINRGGGVEEGGAVYTFVPCNNLIVIDTTVTRSGGTFTATFNESGATYQWWKMSFGGGSEQVFGATDRDFTPTSNGRYYVHIKWNGCEALSGNHRILNVGINQESVLMLNTYPEPAFDFLQIDLPSEVRGASIDIYSMHGQLVGQQTIQGRDKIDVRNLDSGSYFLNIQDNDSNQIHKARFTIIK